MSEIGEGQYFPRLPEEGVLTNLAYSVRSAIIQREKHFRLEPDALVWESRDGNGRIAYRDVARVYLFAGSSQYGRAANCTIVPKTGRRLVFGTVHFTSLTSCENRAAIYGPFVCELLRRISRQAPGAKIMRGSQGQYGIYVGGIVALVGIIALIVFTAGATLANAFVFVFAAILALVAIIGSQLKHVRPQPIDPLDPPSDLTGVIAQGTEES